MSMGYMAALCRPCEGVTSKLRTTARYSTSFLIKSSIVVTDDMLSVITHTRHKYAEVNIQPNTPNYVRIFSFWKVILPQKHQEAIKPLRLRASAVKSQLTAPK